MAAGEKTLAHRVPHVAIQDVHSVRFGSLHPREPRKNKTHTQLQTSVVQLT